MPSPAILPAPEASAQRALSTSGLAWLVALACALAFVPPLLAETLSSLLRGVLVAATLVGALLLHWVYLGLAAHRLQRSVPGWLALAVALFPIGGATALILLNWLAQDPEGRTGPPAPHPG
jgi:uncharacterized membrane protein YhaH (DUF805 family)